MNNMADIRQALSRFWARLTQREQISILIMGTAIGIFAAYMLIARPAIAYQQAAERSLQSESARLGRIMALLEQAQGGNTALIDRSKPARARVLDAARQAGITIEQIEPRGEGFSIYVSNINAVDLFGWINAVETKQGVAVSNASISKSLSGGALDAEISFGVAR